VQSGARLPRRADRARLVAWNIRWFPDGGPGKSESEHPTDTHWLACALAYLNADVVALEEVKAYPRAQQKLDEVRAQLDQLTRGSHRARLDDCQPVAAQHVGLLWNEKRVKAQDFDVFAQLNPLAGPCQDHLRPGLGARFRFPRGLDLEVIAVHLKSGDEPRAQELRARSLARLPSVLEAVKRRHKDDDLVVLGDFNTMGCSSCSPAVAGAAERQSLAAGLAQASPPLTVLPTKPGCSQYYSGKAGLLDLVVATSAMRELGASAEVSASGLCGELACGSLPHSPPAAYRELSDHCPIVIDLLDQDLD
jgi:endonuclease/exonuclease/phosphatase family metal-dependent hydrolase